MSKALAIGRTGHMRPIDRIGLGANKDASTRKGLAPPLERSYIKKLDKPTKYIALTFDGKVVSVIAIKKAAYKYVRSFSADIAMEGDRINCQLTFSSPVSEEEAGRLVEDFKKEVLDQDLRERLKAETEAVRNVILAYAFSKTGLISDESLSRD